MDNALSDTSSVWHVSWFSPEGHGGYGTINFCNSIANAETVIRYINTRPNNVGLATNNEIFLRVPFLPPTDFEL